MSEKITIPLTIEHEKFQIRLNRIPSYDDSQQFWVTLKLYDKLKISNEFLNDVENIEDLLKRELTILIRNLSGEIIK